MRKLAGLVLFLASVSHMAAEIAVTREDPGIQQTSIAGATTETFDAHPTGAFKPQESPVGSYSSGAAIVAPDQYGGAFKTRYIAVGAQSGSLEYSLTFPSLRTYFGFYWAAGDAENRVDFYNGATLVASFHTRDILTELPKAYFGNPNTGQNPDQPYVYLNFTSTDMDSRFDRVVFHSDSTGAGFETDNHSVYDEMIEPPGIRQPTDATLTRARLDVHASTRDTL